MPRRRWLVLGLLTAACASDPNHAGGKGGAGGMTSGTAGSAGAGGKAGSGAGGTAIGGTGGDAGTGGSAGAGGAAIGGTGGSAGSGGSAIGGAGGGAGTGPAPVCGNDVVETGEECDYVNGRICVNCRYSNCGACLAGVGATETVCHTLAGADRVACEALWNCLSDGAFSCINTAMIPGASCDLGGGTCIARCMNELGALAHSADQTEIVRQTGDSSTPVGALWLQAHRAACATSAYRDCGYPHTYGWSACILEPGPVINEVDYQQPGGDSQEFVEIFNNGWGPFDFTGVNLLFFTTSPRTPYLTVPLSGVLPVGAYLVVGTPSVQVPPGVQKIDFPLPSDNIMNSPGGVCLPYVASGRNMLIWGYPAGTTEDPENPSIGCALVGTGEPAGLSDDGTAPHSLCRLPDGGNFDYMINNSATNNLLTWTRPCTTPTPGAANVQ